MFSYKILLSNSNFHKKIFANNIIVEFCLELTFQNKNFTLNRNLMVKLGSLALEK